MKPSRSGLLWLSISASCALGATATFYVYARQERSNAARVEIMAWMNEHNDGRDGRAYLLMPEPADIASGSDPRPMPKRTEPPQTGGEILAGLTSLRDQLAEPSITTTWPHGATTNALGTPHRWSEDADPWLDRHFEMVERARKRQE